MALSTAIKQIERPGRLPIEIYVGGDGQSYQQGFTITVDSVAENLTGVTPTAEIRTLDDSLLATMTAEVVSAAAGTVRISMTRAAADAIEWPPNGPILGQRSIRGRWHLRLDDGATSMVVIAGDVVVTR
jgi:hypothetical protein